MLKKKQLLIVTTALLFVVVLVSLPFLIQRRLERTLLARGADSVLIEDIEFNPFTASLEVADLKVRVNRQTTIAIPAAEINISWFDLIFDAKFIVEELVVTKTVLALEKTAGRVSFGGLQKSELPSNGEAPSLTEFAFESVIIRDSVVHWKSSITAELKIDKFILKNVKSWDPNNKATLDFSGKLNDAPIQFNAILTMFAEKQRMAITGAIDHLDTGPFNPYFSELGLLIGGTLSMNGTFDVQAQGEQVTIDGKSHAVFINGKLTDRQRKTTLFKVAQMDVAGIKLTLPAAIEIDRIKLIQASILPIKSKNALTDIGTLMLNRMRWTPNSFAAKSLLIESLKAELRRDRYQAFTTIGARLDPGKSGHTNTTQSGKSSVTKTNKQTKSFSKADGNFAITLDHFEIDSNSQFRFVDKQTKPEFDQVFHIKNLQLSGLDNRSENARATLAVRSTIGPKGSVLIRGKLNPFASPMRFDLHAKLQQIDLTYLSSYTAKTLGYFIKSGHLNADIAVVVTDKKVAIKNDLMLKKPRFTPENPDLVANLVKQITMPLDKALDMLRDRQGNIKLSLPIDGEPGKLTVGYSDIVHQVVIKAIGAGIKSAAMSYLKAALFPYGTVVTLVDFAVGQAQKIRLAPIQYSKALATQHKNKAYLGKIARLLKERPHLDVSLCPYYANNDARNLDRKHRKKLGQANKDSNTDLLKLPKQFERYTMPLMKLSRRRAELIEGDLVRKFGISAKRILICTPEADWQGASRVEILF